MTEEPAKIEFAEIINLLKPHQISVTANVKRGLRMDVHLNTPLEFLFTRDGDNLNLVSICELDNPETILTFDEFTKRISWQVEDRGYLQ